MLFVKCVKECLKLIFGYSVYFYCIWVVINNLFLIFGDCKLIIEYLNCVIVFG